MVDLKGKPFYLNAEDIQWVQETLQRMSLTEKVGQLFFPVGMGEDREVLKQLIDGIQPGGMMYRTGPMEQTLENHNYLQSLSKIPMLIAANLEAGGQGIATEGTMIGNQMQVAATDDPEMAYKLGAVAAREGGACGCNWAFAPVVDIDMNFRNPITNVRTYGSSARRVAEMGSAYMKGVHKNGLGVSIKHFPGDGVDERDQHLLTSINSLSKEEWDASYGMVYQRLIDEGAQTVMVGHIAQPAYENHFDNIQEEREPIPATLSPNLLQKLLREQMGFNGVISTDASVMLGFAVAEARATAVPRTIACGCDILLFNLSIEEDFRFMMAGIENGILSVERVEEAVTRILAFKAALKLHKAQQDGTLQKTREGLETVGCEEHQGWAAECADKAVTLVKDTAKILPVNPEKYKKVLVYPIENIDALFAVGNVKERFFDSFVKQLEDRGFEVTVKYQEAADFTAMFSRTVAKMKEEYDLVIYLANIGTASNQTAVRLGFDMFTNSPWFVKEVDTMLISVANPYHLLDAPMMKTFINAYSYNEDVMTAVVRKICGESEFKGVNPVDPFCGRYDTKF